MPYGIKNIYITPKTPKVNPLVVKRLLEADVIVSGPGDLYTNQLPVLMVPQVKNAFLKSKAKKIFILNVANKPFETKNFTLDQFVKAFTDHLGVFPFDTVIANIDFSHPIPKKYRYKYISLGKQATTQKQYQLVTGKIVDASFPIYHDSQKLALLVSKTLEEI